MTTPTRKQYLDHEVTHEEYYRAIAETAGIWLGPDHPLVKQALTSTDEHYNDVPLKVWDSYFPIYRMQLQRALKAHAGTEGVSLSDNTCTLKQAVRDAIARIPKEVTVKVDKLDPEQWQ